MTSKQVDKQAETIKGFDGLITIHNQTNVEQQRCIDNLKETIKGLDRATVEHTRIIAERDETIDTLTNVNQAHSAMLKLKHNEISELEQRIATLLEAQASVPTRDTNGTIEAQAKRIRNQEAVIKQYSTEMQALQRKVQEQDERLAGLKLYQSGLISLKDFERDYLQAKEQP
jgi:predicted RNase H-like nuclease (RuvC/YqgF family)